MTAACSSVDFAGTSCKRSPAISARQTWPCLALFRSDCSYCFVAFADMACLTVDSAAFCCWRGRAIALVSEWCSDATAADAGCSSSCIAYAAQSKKHLSYL